VIANVLDKVGGAIAVDDGGHLGVVALGAPWGKPGYGGNDPGAEERPSIDVIVGSAKMLTGNDFGAGKVIDPDPNQLAPALVGAPTATIDLLITSEASANDLVLAIDVAHRASPSQTTGVGATSMPFPKLGMDGKVDTGPVGANASLTIPDVKASPPEYAIILTRYVRRARPQLVTCTASGKVTVSFDVATDGTLSNVKGAPPCIADVFTHMTVAPPHAKTSATAELDYP
jgi:hypothetical protein